MDIELQKRQAIDAAREALKGVIGTRASAALVKARCEEVLDGLLKKAAYIPSRIEVSVVEDGPDLFLVSATSDDPNDIEFLRAHGWVVEMPNPVNLAVK